MNFIDTYDIAGTTTPPPRSEDPAEPSLNEEVSQVIGQLGKFWGGFRKQSQVAFETARKDLSQVVTQAQKELSKLAPEAISSTSDTTSNETPSGGLEDTPSSGIADPEEAVKAEDGPSSPHEEPTSPNQSLFSRIQSSLPPNIASTLQKNLPDTLREVSDNVTANVDFAQLKATLSTEFQRVQGVTRAQAEEYVHKSETLLKDAGEFLKDAVKVVPPDGAEGPSAGVVWDGSDVWVMPSPIGTPGWGGSAAADKGKGKQRTKEQAAALRQQRAAGTRADALLQRLKHDPEMIKLDPLVDESVREVYQKWVKDEIDSKDDGIDGSIWSENIQNALSDKIDGDALGSTRDVLVPSTIDKQTFWTRYFFRIYQIEQEEERRKALLDGATENDEDFSWEDEDDETITPSAGQDAPPSTAETTLPEPSSEAPKSAHHSAENLAGIAVVVHSVPSSQVPTPANTSPRDSSEDSYDVVSSGNISAGAEAEVKEEGKGKSAKTVKAGEESEGDADSDWE